MPCRGELGVRRVFHDIPCAGRPARIWWRQRTWSCPRSGCRAGTFAETLAETLEDLSAPQARLTRRAIWWTIGQLAREHAPLAGWPRRLGGDWHPVGRGPPPRLADLAGDESEFAGV